MTLGREVHDDTALLIDVCSIDSIWGKERELAEFLADHGQQPAIAADQHAPCRARGQQ